MNIKDKIDLGLNPLLIMGFIIIMGIGCYFTYSALTQGILFSYIENFSIQGLDSKILFHYLILLLMKTLVAFVMYSFITASIITTAVPLMILSLLPFKSNKSRL